MDIDPALRIKGKECSAVAANHAVSVNRHEFSCNGCLQSSNYLIGKKK